MSKSAAVITSFFSFALAAVFGNIEDSSAFRQFLSEHIPLRSVDGKISIPENIKHVKLDIGLSYSAPMSQYWLSHEEDLIVFGFRAPPDICK